ncbi:MAG: hypothetical protein R3C49_01000 [Planctomycetaceae bacterium]
MLTAARFFLCFLGLSASVAGLCLPAAAQEDSPAADRSRSETDAASDWDRLIYVPFRELQKVFDNQDASAVMPYADYLRLIKAAVRAADGVTSAPEAVIAESHFTGSVQKDIVQLQAEFSISVLKSQGWARLPLNFGDVSVGKVTSDNDENVLLKGVAQGQYELLLKGEGKHKVTIDLLATVKTSPENRSFRVNCPSVGISDLKLTIPEPDQSIEVAPLQVLLPVEGSDNQQTVVRASLGATDHFEVRWNPEAGSKPVMDLLTSVTNRMTTRIETGLIQSTAVLNYEVLRGELTEVTLLCPQQVRIIDVVSSAGRIRSWKAEAVGETHQQIRIELLTPVTDRFQVEVQTEATPEGDTFQLLGKSDDGKLHSIHADGVVRESGQISVMTDSSLTTVVKTQSGVKRIDAGPAGKAPAADGRQAWEFSGTSGILVLQVKPVEPRLLVNQGSRIVFDDDELRLTTRLTYTVERAGVFALNLSYPEGLTIDTVRADGMSEFHVDKAEGRLTLSLTQKRMGAINVDITAHRSFDAAAEGIETEIPTITPLDVKREEGRIALFAPQFLDVVTVDSKLSGLFPAEEAETGNIGRAVRVSSWKYTQRPISLTVRTTPRPAQLTASVATTATIEPNVMKVSSVLQFIVQNAGIDTYRVSVPEAIADKVRFRSPNSNHTIQQRDRATEAVDGWTTWTLVLQDEVVGTVQLMAEWEVPLEEMEASTEAQKLVLEPVRVLPPFTDEQADKRKATLSQTTGELRLLRHESLSINADGGGETMEKVDVRELILMPRDGYLAFRYFAQPVSVDISIRRHEVHDVVATVVSRAAVEVVTDKQPLASFRCRLRITSSERQRLRIDLPTGAELQAPLLDSRRTTFEAAKDVTATDGWEAYYVNISREGTSDQEFLLSFQFRCPIAGGNEFPYEGQGSKQIIRLPLIGSGSGGTVTQETRLAVWGPKDIAFVGEPTNWTLSGRQTWNLLNPLLSPTAPQEAESLNRWIGEAGGGSEFARQGNVSVYRSLGQNGQVNIVWWNRPFLVAVISVALLVIGLILRRTPWENRLTLTIVAVLGIALWSLKDSSETLQFVTAGSPGIAAVAGIWLLGMFLGTRRSSTGSSPDSPPGADPPSDAPKSPTQSSAPVRSGPAAPALPPGAVSPSPDVVNWMNSLSGGK